MTSIDVSAEEVVIEMLRRTGSCSLDDLVIQLPNLNWSEIFGPSIGCRGTAGCCFVGSLARPITSHFPSNMRHSAHHPAKEA